MAKGGEFATLDVPWAYAYVLAFSIASSARPAAGAAVASSVERRIPAIVRLRQEAFDRRVAALRRC